MKLAKGGSLLRLSRKVPAYAVLWTALAWPAERPPVLSIEDAVAEAIENNPGLIAERLGIPVAEAASITAGLRPNPVASYSADHLDALGSGFNETNGAGPAEFAVRVDVPWERAHKRELRLDAASYQKRIIQAKIAESVRRLSLDVALACIEVMEAKSKLALANENLRSLEGIVTLNQRRVSGGAIAPVELTRSRVAMLQFRASVKTAELALLTARTRLQTLLGRRPGDGVIDIAGEMKPALPKEGPDLGRIQDIALRSRPDLQAIQLDQARSQADLRLQIAQGKIDYTFCAEYRRQQGINGTGNSLGFFLSTPIPVFHRNQGEIARVTAEQEQLRKSLEAQRALVSGEVVAAWQEYESARKLTAEIEGELLRPAEEARSVTAYVYQTGASSLLDVLDAQRAFNETMSAYYSAQANFLRAARRLSATVGQEVNP